MPFVLGADEAGYGPNLGPLVVGASAWQVPDQTPLDSLYELVSDAIAPKPLAKTDRRLIVADSKQLYKAGGSLAVLERGVLTALGILGRVPQTWTSLWPLIDGDSLADLLAQPWHEGYDEPLPVAADRADLQAAQSFVEQNLPACGPRIVDLRARAVFPQAFNEQVGQCGNKAEVLSLTTLQLIQRMIGDLPSGRVQVVCDKHGGRARYAALLQHVFTDYDLRTCRESREVGVYELRRPGRELEIRFLMKGERILPTALASMAAKYVRELAMRPFNAFWLQQVAGLRPTAGYPEDARRFWSEIRPSQQRLKIADAVLWRTR